MKLFFVFLEFFACNLKYDLYNVDIRSKREREKERKKMQKATHINDFIQSLPRIVQKKIWKVVDENGTVVQGVSATDNRKSTAQKYIDEKYPNRVLKLTFSHFGDLITIPR